MLPPGPTTHDTSVDSVSRALLPIDALAATLAELRINLDVHAFINLVAQKAAATTPSSTSQKSRKDVHKAAVESLLHSFPVPPPAESVIKRVAPSSNASDREKRRKMLAATRAAFNDTVPMPYVICWAGNYENLQFIRADITVLSESDETQVQTFSEWCLWDTGAQISLINGNRLGVEVKGANSPDQGFLQMEILFYGVQGPKIQSTVGYRPALPNNSQFIILGQRNLIDNIEYSVTPRVFNAEVEMSDATYGAMELVRYYDPVDETVQPFI